jgi:hypothetical protein
MQKNAQAEPLFRRWLLVKLVREGRTDLKKAINSGSEIAKCSQEAVRRYINSVSSTEGWAVIVPEDESTSHIEMRKQLHCWMFRDEAIDPKTPMKVTKASNQPANQNDEVGKQSAVDSREKPS